MTKGLFVEIGISTLVLFMILINYKKIKFTKKHSTFFLIIGIVLLFDEL